LWKGGSEVKLLIKRIIKKISRGYPKKLVMRKESIRRV
jgi:hypothetical protein